MTAEELAEFFHTTYERLSGQGRAWDELGDDNRATLIAAMREVLCQIFGSQFVAWQETSEAEYEKYLVTAEKWQIEQSRVCACGHSVNDHIDLPAPDGTPLLLCTQSPDCGDSDAAKGPLGLRCSIPEVHS